MSEQQYVLGAKDDELARLNRQSRLIGADCELFLQRFIKPWQRVLEIGCGTGGATSIMAKLMDNQGELIAIDKEAPSLAFAKDRLYRAGYDCVRFMQDDLENAPSLGLFDVVYARTVLHHLPDVVSAVQTLSACVKPGGYIAFEEPIMRAGMDHTPSQVVAKVLDWYCQLGQVNGVDFHRTEQMAQIFHQEQIPILHQHRARVFLHDAKEKALLGHLLDVVGADLVKHNIASEQDIMALKQTLALEYDSALPLPYIGVEQVLGRVS